MATPLEPTRPTTRMIAKLAGISSTAVSMALRDHPKISNPTRRKVREIASKLGYRPDPDVAKLMHHLRSRHKRSFQSTLCALTTISKTQDRVYLTQIIESAQQRANSLGYGLTVMHLEDEEKPRMDLQRVLRSRGIEGLLLLPMATPRNFENLLEWSEFSVVSSTYGVLTPRFHRVVPHQFHNMLLLCEHLKELGYRRMGLVLDAKHDLRVHHSFSAAIAWQNLFGGTEFVQPLIYSGDEPENLKEWFGTQAPDVIVSGGAKDEKAIARRLGLRIPGIIGFASTAIDATATSFSAGVEERAGEIGTRAIELLASMVQRGEKGVPDVPSVTMVEGCWFGGRSARKKRAPAGKKINDQAPSVSSSRSTDKTLFPSRSAGR